MTMGGKDRASDPRRRHHRKKEVTITLKSEPLKPASGTSIHPTLETKRRPRDFKKKGARGPSWIG